MHRNKKEIRSDYIRDKSKGADSYNAHAYTSYVQLPIKLLTLLPKFDSICLTEGLDLHSQVFWIILSLAHFGKCFYLYKKPLEIYI